MNPNKSIDICILDNKTRFQNYIRILKDLNYNILLINSLEKRNELFQCEANAFIIAYTLGCDGTEKKKMAPEEMKDKLISGKDIAEKIREIKKDAYIHFVTESDTTKKPYDSDKTFDEMVRDGLINSYSSRKMDKIYTFLDAITAAIQNV